MLFLLHYKSPCCLPHTWWHSHFWHKGRTCILVPQNTAIQIQYHWYSLPLLTVTVRRYRQGNKASPVRYPALTGRVYNVSEADSFAELFFKNSVRTSLFCILLQWSLKWVLMLFQEAENRSKLIASNTSSYFVLCCNLPTMLKFLPLPWQQVHCKLSIH